MSSISIRFADFLYRMTAMTPWLYFWLQMPHEVVSLGAIHTKPANVGFVDA